MEPPWNELKGHSAAVFKSFIQAYKNKKPVSLKSITLPHKTIIRT